MSFHLRRFFVVLLIGLIALGLVGTASAGSDNGTTFALDCKGFTGTGGEVVLDRDNTGTGREAFILSATDGAGNVIYQPVVDTFFVGGTVSWAGSDPVRWTAKPQYNPLKLRVVSRAGEGFNEKTITVASGTCADLPTFALVPLGTLLSDLEGFKSLDARLLNGLTSPSVPLNGVPPRPSVELEVVNLLEGYLIVNTDNLSVRSGPDAKYTVVGIVDGGTRLVPLGRNKDGSWWYVQAGDLVGWVKAEFTIIRGDVSGAGVIPSLGEITQPAMLVYSNNTVYASPRASSLPLCSLTGNMAYPVVGRDKGGTWFQLQVTCDGVLVKGWIAADQGALRNPANVFIPVTTG
jgi:hypothetical protein